LVPVTSIENLTITAEIFCVVNAGAFLVALAFKKMAGLSYEKNWATENRKLPVSAC
jgi:hypothetical protein